MAKMEIARWNSGALRLYRTGDQYTLIGDARDATARFTIIGDELLDLARVAELARRDRERTSYEIETDETD